MNPIARALSPVLCASVGSSPAFKYYTVQMNVGLVKGCVCCLMYYFNISWEYICVDRY